MRARSDKAGDVGSVLVSLGSNIQPAPNLLSAVARLTSVVTVVAASRVFATVPVAARPMAQFLNAAVEIETDLSPEVLKLEILRDIESALGRVRSHDRNAPRTIDLDISLFGNLVLRDEDLGLEIPDPEILTRPHVAIPLADLAPERVHPISGRSLAEIAGVFAGQEGVCLAPDPEALVAWLRANPSDVAHRRES
jgi:2-amino-4-hydroxy-6-hydroxymethyldihydropteridine diphosphokinase